MLGYVAGKALAFRALTAPERRQVSVRDRPITEEAIALADARPIDEVAREQASAWTRLTSQAQNPNATLPKPVRESPVKRIVMQRSTPTVSRMLDDAYQSLAMQLHQFRESAHVAEWDTPKANAFGRLVTSLVALQETERKDRASYALGELSDAELAKLGRQAQEFLAEKGDLPPK